MNFEILKNITSCQLLPTLLLGNGSLDDIVVGVKSSLESWQLIVVMLGLGIFASVIAKTFNYIRKNIYKDKVKSRATFGKELCMKFPRVKCSELENFRKN